VIVENKPAYVRRGVTQLMYVGDDDAVEQATTRKFEGLGTAAKVLGVGIAVLWLLGEISSPRRR
jgi:hypothetical protein